MFSRAPNMQAPLLENTPTARFPREDTAPRYPREDTVPRYPRDDTSSRFTRDDVTQRYPRDDPAHHFSHVDATPRFSPGDTIPRFPRDDVASRFPRSAVSPSFPRDDPTSPFARDNTTAQFPREDPSRFPRDDSSHFPRDDSSRFPRDDAPRFPQEDTSRFPRDDTSRFPREDTSRFPQEELTPRLPRDNTSRFPREDTTLFPRDNPTHFPRDNSSFSLPPISGPNQHSAPSQSVFPNQAISTIEEPRSVVSRFLDEVNVSDTESPQLPLKSETQDDVINETHESDDEQDASLPKDGPIDVEVKARLAKGCGCTMNCFSKFSFDDIYDHILDVREMGKCEKDLYVMGALSELEINDLEETKKGTPRQQVRNIYMHSDQKICRATFLMLYDLGERKLRNLKKHVMTIGVTPRIHKNLGKTFKKDNDLGNKLKKKRKLIESNQGNDSEKNKNPRLGNSPQGNTPVSSCGQSASSSSGPVASTSGSQMTGKQSSMIDQQVAQALNEIEQMEGEGIRGNVKEVAAPEAYEIKVMHDLEARVKKGCGCKMDCLRKFPSSVICEHIMDVREMSRNEKDIYVLVALSQDQEEFDEFTKKGTPRMIVTHTYWHMGNKVCRPSFKLIYDVGKKRLESLQRHLVEKGIVPRVHASTGKKPWNSVRPDDLKRVINFIKNYTDVVGTPQPGAPKVGPEKQTLIMLPMGTRKKDTWKLYTERCDEQGVRSLKYSTFISCWKNLLPYIKCPESERSPHSKRALELI